MSHANFDALDDEELARRAVADPNALAVLCGKHIDGVYRYCLRRLQHREAAEDATQVVFERAMTGLKHYQTRSTFRGWLFTIAHNVVVDQWRREHPTIPLDTSFWLEDATPSPEERAVTQDEYAWMRRLIAQLGEQDRQLIELRLAGLNDREIADVLGVTHGSVRTRQHRLLVRLRSLSVASAGVARQGGYGARD